MLSLHKSSVGESRGTQKGSIFQTLAFNVGAVCLNAPYSQRDKGNGKTTNRETKKAVLNGRVFSQHMCYGLLRQFARGHKLEPSYCRNLKRRRDGYIFPDPMHVWVSQQCLQSWGINFHRHARCKAEPFNVSYMKIR